MAAIALHNFGNHTIDGRLRGSYVYMMLCQQIDGPVHVKVGRSSNPFSRLGVIRSWCAIIPRIIAVAEVASSRKAVVIERELHNALHRWHSHLEWFKVDPSDRPNFNKAWRSVLLKHSDKSRPLVWRQYEIDKIIKGYNRRLAPMNFKSDS